MVPDLPAALAGLTLLLWLGAAREVARGCRRMRRLPELSDPAPAVWPRVSIVFAARNEAATVGAAVPTMLAVDYPDLEVVAVDDRSEDGTGEILDRLAAAEPRLRVDHVRTLPPGWLGKNHALHHGAAQAAGEWILFTDADVHFAPDALRRAIARATAANLDHLSVVPRLHERGHLLGAGVAAFSLVFSLFVRPWHIPNPRSPSHGGIGAFNLVRAAAYRRLGGHEPLRLRPDDDIKLGKLMKGGGRSEMLPSGGLVTVEWYASAGQLVRGLTKNSYAGTDYRAWFLLGGVAAHGIFFLWPLAGMVLLTGPAGWLNAAAVVVMLGTAVDHQRLHAGRWWHGLLFPVGLVLLDYALLRSFVVTHATGGITWRGTRYPLRDLRSNRL